MKVGGYGFYRILFPIFPSLTLYFSSLAIVFCSISIVYTSFTTLRQVDIKRIIAYSSISHMNIALIGFFGFNAISISGSFLLMLGHGFVSGGLFFMIGMLYNRFKTKLIKYYSGLVYVMPVFSSFFFIFLLGNISLPTTCNFLGEFLVLLGIVQNLNFIGIYSICLSIFFCSFYTLYVFNRITFGLPNQMFRMKDLSILEVSLLLPLLFFIFFFGIYPKPVLDIIFLSALKTSVIAW